jgi:hypothetical protein
MQVSCEAEELGGGRDKMLCKNNEEVAFGDSL